MEHDFALKVAQAVECRDYSKRKAAEDEKAKKRKRSKPHWAFEQKARWESKGNMQKRGTVQVEAEMEPDKAQFFVTVSCHRSLR